VPVVVRGDGVEVQVRGHLAALLGSMGHPSSLRGVDSEVLLCMESGGSRVPRVPLSGDGGPWLGRYRLRPTRRERGRREMPMKRRIRIAAATLAVAAGLIGAVAAPASALSPSQFFKPAGALCTAQGGSFVPSAPNARYTCLGDFSEAQLGAARALCEGAYGVFGWTFSSSAGVYRCQASA
jgi:hypothetical protein